MFGENLNALIDARTRVRSRISKLLDTGATMPDRIAHTNTPSETAGLSK